MNAIPTGSIADDDQGPTPAQAVAAAPALAVGEPNAVPLPADAPPADEASRDIAIGYTFAALGAVLFSSKGIIIKLTYGEGISPETLLALRMLMSVPVFLVIGAMSVRDRLRRGEALPSGPLLLYAALIGVLGYWFASYMDFLGLALISAQFERLILFTYPLFVVVFGALMFKQPVQRRTLLAFAVSYVGLALIFVAKFRDVGTDVALGAGFVVASAMAFAFYQLLAKQVIGKIGPRLFTCVAMTAAGAVAIGQFFLFEPVSLLAVSPTVLGYGVLLAIGATVVPTFLMNAALHRISAQANATIAMLSPVATIIMAVIILGETLTVRDMIGTALVLGGIGWFTLGGRK